MAKAEHASAEPERNRDNVKLEHVDLGHMAGLGHILGESRGLRPSPSPPSRTLAKPSRCGHRAVAPSDPSDDYMLRGALEGTHFFLGENQHAQKLTYFLVLL